MVNFVMKYGVIDFDLTVKFYWDNSWNNKALLNIGDASEYLVTEQLLKHLKVKEKDIVRLGINELITYRGEHLIVPLNIAFDSYIGYNNIFENLSPDIIPVFLGISLTNINLNNKQLQCLKKFAPVGCRDERTYIFLINHGIEAYLNGCLATIIDLSKINADEKTNDKVLFIDVPQDVAQYIPETLKKDIAFVNQEIYCRENEFIKDISPKEWAKIIWSKYKNPRMIVTSRFHGAVLAIANNIPCIITLEKYTFRFSWLRNYFNIYTEKNFDEINWNTYIDYSKVNLLKNIMLDVAITRIKAVIDKYQKILLLTEMQQANSNEEYEIGNQVLYYHDAIERIKELWNKNDNIEYGFWGINDNTDIIYNYITENYCNAKLVDVYDMFKKVTYKNLCSKHPNDIVLKKNQNNYYIIVTAYLASRVAFDILDKIDFDKGKIILCERKFINVDYL